MSPDILIVFGLLVLALVLFSTEWVSFDFSALLVVAVLMLTGVLSPAQGLSGLSNAATVTIAAMFVVSEGVRRTGGLEPVIGLFSSVADRAPALAPLFMMTVIAVVSAFINNTAAVALFIPVVITVANRMGTSPSKLLIPLSFASMFGGVCTLLGTSTNILVGAIAEDHGQAAFGMFEFAPMGLVFLAAGMAYFFLGGRRLVPARREPEATDEAFEMRAFVTDVRIRGDFDDLGSPLSESDFLDGLDLDIMQAFDTAGEPLGEARHRDVEAGQVIRIRGAAEEIRALVHREGVEIAASDHLDDIDLEKGEFSLIEAVVAPDGGLTGQSIDEIEFYDEFGAVLLALRRGSELTQTGMREINLKGGDSLLLLIRRDQARTLRRDRRFVLATEIETAPYRTERLPIALAVLAGIVALTAAGVVPVQVAAFSGAVLLVLSGCLTSDEAYEAINWKVIFLLAGIIPLGLAMDETGAATLVADGVLEMLGGLGPHAVLGGFLGLTMLMTGVISNQATAAILAPIAIESARTLGVDPRPMLMAVTFGASLSFITPVGYQTNTMIYGAGQYRFTDFTRVGTPLNLLFWVLGTALIPWFWAFGPPS